MTTDHNDAKNIKEVLEKLPGVKSAGEIRIKNKIIEQIVIENEPLGKLTIRRLEAKDAPALFDFYFQGLSEKSRNFFGNPYPLFSSPLNSAQELSARILDWQKEDDWTFLNLIKDEEIVGVCLLKRYKTERPVSGLAIKEDFQGMGWGTLLQTLINEQACLLNLKKLYAGAAQDNIVSLRLHEKCGFKKTGRLTPHFIYKDGVKKIDRYDIEMVKEFDYE